MSAPWRSQRHLAGLQLEQRATPCQGPFDARSAPARRLPAIAAASSQNLLA
jgi:hypothetical protein